MKTKIYLGKNESLADAEEQLEKALKAKKECSHGEKYCDAPLNEFHDHILEQHNKLLTKIVEEVSVEVLRQNAALAKAYESDANLFKAPRPDSVINPHKYIARRGSAGNRSGNRDYTYHYQRIGDARGGGGANISGPDGKPKAQGQSYTTPAHTNRVLVSQGEAPTPVSEYEPKNATSPTKEIVVAQQKSAKIFKKKLKTEIKEQGKITFRPVEEMTISEKINLVHSKADPKLEHIKLDSGETIIHAKGKQKEIVRELEASSTPSFTEFLRMDAARRYDEYGYDRDGFDKDGYDMEGYNRDGFNRDGFNKYDEDGFDEDGYNKDGYDRDGFDKDGYDEYGYDEDGLDIDGNDGAGYDIDGYDVDGLDIEGNLQEDFDLEEADEHKSEHEENIHPVIPDIIGRVRNNNFYNIEGLEIISEEVGDGKFELVAYTVPTKEHPKRQRLTGDWQRNFITVDGKPRIVNTSLGVDSDLRHRAFRIGAQINKIQQEALRGTGGRISVMAADKVGGYNWCNSGFSFTNEDGYGGLLEFRKQFKEDLKRYEGIELTDKELKIMTEPCHFSAFDTGKKYLHEGDMKVGLTPTQLESGSITGRKEDANNDEQYRLTSTELNSKETNRMMVHFGKKFMLGRSWFGAWTDGANSIAHQYAQHYDSNRRKALELLGNDYHKLAHRVRKKIIGTVGYANPSGTRRAGFQSVWEDGDD